MNLLKIEATKSTPFVHFDSNEKELIISGKSYPENPTEFFTPIIDWIKEYVDKHNGEIIFNLKLTYLNTSSTKVFMSLFDFLETQNQNGKSIKIDWHFEKGNEMAKESGEEFKEDLNLNFNIIED